MLISAGEVSVSTTVSKNDFIYIYAKYLFEGSILLLTAHDPVLAEDTLSSRRADIYKLAQHLISGLEG